MFCSIKEELYRIVEGEKSFENDSDALFYMKEQMETILVPMLRTYIDEATLYRARRDMENIKLERVVETERTKLEELFSDDKRIAIKLMSSIGAKLNVIGESDIDFGICVINLNDSFGILDQTLLERIEVELLKLGYVYSHAFNAENPKNRYFSFTKIVDGIEVEAKVRDYATTEVFLRLHERLDNSLTDEQITLYTYAKYLLSQDKEDRRAYKNFKKILYESVFYGVDGAFVFPVP